MSSWKETKRCELRNQFAQKRKFRSHGVRLTQAIFFFFQAMLPSSACRRRGQSCFSLELKIYFRAVFQTGINQPIRTFLLSSQVISHTSKPWSSAPAPLGMNRAKREGVLSCLSQCTRSPPNLTRRPRDPAPEAKNSSEEWTLPVAVLRLKVGRLTRGKFAFEHMSGTS